MAPPRAVDPPWQLLPKHWPWPDVWNLRAKEGLCGGRVMVTDSAKCAGNCTEGISTSHCQGDSAPGSGPRGLLPCHRKPTHIAHTLSPTAPMAASLSRQKEEAKTKHSETTLPPQNLPKESIPGPGMLRMQHRSERGGVEAAGPPFLCEQPGCGKRGLLRLFLPAIGLGRGPVILPAMAATP